MSALIIVERVPENHGDLSKITGVFLSTKEALEFVHETPGTQIRNEDKKGNKR